MKNTNSTLSLIDWFAPYFNKTRAQSIWFWRTAKISGVDPN